MNHLESRVTAVSVEKDEVIIKLKSEALVLKAKAESIEKNFDDKVEEIRSTAEVQIREKYDEDLRRQEEDIGNLT